MIIGVTGYMASGKDAFCEILEEKGFKHISLSNLLREILSEKGLEPSRENLSTLGNELRFEEGDGVLAKKALERIDETNWLISSIGRVEEVNELKKKDFILIFIDAKQEIRFERLRNRNRAGDSITLKDFKKQEERENKGGGKMFREFKNLKKEADFIINNNGSLEAFKYKIKNFLENKNIS